MGSANQGKCAACGLHPAVAGFMCPDCFKDRHGITVDEYRANKLHRTETPWQVAVRLKGQPETEPISHPEKPDNSEKKPAKEETKAPIPETMRHETEIIITLPDAVIEQIEAIAVKEFRTLALQVAYYLHKGMQG